jgi:hypothetical protein
METVAAYRKHADECLALARRARSPEEREAILKMATAWDELANTRERKITKERPLPPAHGTR